MEITLVSFVPWAINEDKPGLIPGNFYIPPADEGKPGIIHINDCMSNLYVRDGQTYPVTHPAEEVANALVNDYCSSQLQYSETSKPALFWVVGKLSKDQVLVEHKAKVALAKSLQNAWFMKLVRLADDDWAKTKQHRLITDLQRYAAKSLGLFTKPWMEGIELQEFVRCPACATLTDTRAAVCANCNYIVNKERAKELGISLVPTSTPQVAKSA